MMIPLRYYQQEAVDAVKDAYYTQGRKRVVVGKPTGSGKTRTGIALIHELLHPTERAIFLVPSIDLVEQTRDAFLAWYAPSQVGIVQAETNQVGRWITIASKDTLDEAGRLHEVLDAQGGMPFSIIIVDECHKSVTQGYRDLLAQLAGPYSLVVGLSATPYREDRQSLLKVFPDGLVYSKDMFELILEGWLANPIIHTIPTNLDLSDLAVDGIVTSLDDISESLQKKLVASNRYERAFAYWNKVARDRRTAIFAQNTQDAYGFEKYFTGKGVPCVFINNKTPLAKRKELYAALKRKEVVLVFFNVGTTGLDIPEMDGLIMARQTENKGLVHQIYGRVMRTCQETGKQDALILNITDKDHVLCTFDFLMDRTDEVISVREALREKVEGGEKQQKPAKKDEGESSYEISMRVREMKSSIYNAFTGHGWEGNLLEGTYTKHCGSKYGTLEAEGDLTGWHVYHIAPSGRRLRLSKEPLEFNHARYRGQKHIESMKERERMEEGTSTRLALDITEGQMRYITNRKVLVVPKDTRLTQADYIELKRLLEQHGHAFPRIEGVPHRVAHYYGKNILLSLQQHKEKRVS